MEDGEVRQSRPRSAERLDIDLSNHRLYVPEQEENGAPAAKIVVFEAVPSLLKE